VQHGLDPAQKQPPVYLPEKDIARHKEALGSVAAIAQPRLDQLFALVGSSGCGVVLSDKKGLIIDHRFGTADAPIFQGWGLGAGADWSEAAQGTNGIGTCLVERRGVVIHKDQHFMVSNIAMSCIDAPVYGAEGDDIVIGATRAARRAFGLKTQGAFRNVPLGDLIGHDTHSKGFARAQSAAIIRALVRADNNVSLAARELGVSRATLYRRMKELKINN